MDEQLICKQTGHRSLAVRSYKRATTAMQKDVSSVIQGTKRCSSTESCNVARKVSCTDTDSSRPVNININLNVQ